MSTIGRIFIVVNLALAGAFVGFAGSFLQNHTDYKAQLAAAETAAAAAKEDAAKALQSKDDEARRLDRELRASNGQLESAQTENKSLAAANSRLEAQLATLSSDITKLTSHTTTMAQEIKQSRDVVAAFSRDYLAGEGDVIKHLANLGVQWRPLDARLVLGLTLHNAFGQQTDYIPVTEFYVP